jgi:hypothetical protein
MPELIERAPTPEEENHPNFLISEADAHIFILGKAKGLQDQEMWASFVLAIAGIPRIVEEGGAQSILYTADELKSDAGLMSRGIYDEAKQRLICFLPAPNFKVKSNGQNA